MQGEAILAERSGGLLATSCFRRCASAPLLFLAAALFRKILFRSWRCSDHGGRWRYSVKSSLRSLLEVFPLELLELCEQVRVVHVVRA